MRKLINEFMKRTIIRIDEELCNGCEACVQGCHEGALQMIDGKARMVSELFCDGLGACIGECPVGAISLEEREAEPYDEIATLKRMIPKGEHTIIAHLKHLKDHGETDYLKQAVGFLRANKININFAEVHNYGGSGCASKPAAKVQGGGCPGRREVSFVHQKPAFSFITASNTSSVPDSQLRQWPVQLHLLNPEAQYFRNADVVLAADCVPFSFPDFHNRYLAGKTLAIACPKLDSNKDSYVEKIKTMISNYMINTLTVVIMEVPCCSGLLRLAQQAVAESGKRIPVKLATISIRGEVLGEEWI